MTDATIAVVPSWNAAARMAEVLAALVGQVDGLIVVDNASQDGTVEAARAMELRGPEKAWLEVVPLATNVGFAGAVNVGLLRALDAGAAAVLVVNDDAVFTPGAVANLQEALARRPDAAVATAKLVYRRRPDVLNGAGGCWWSGRGLARLRGEGATPTDAFDQAGDPDYPSGAASLFRAEALRDVGLFDESWYLYYEDVDWGLRARAKGWSISFAPRAVVMHEGSAGTMRDPARRRYYNVRNRLRFAARYATPAGRIWAWTATLGLLAKQPARLVLPSRREDALAVIEGVADHLAGRVGPWRREAGPGES